MGRAELTDVVSAVSQAETRYKPLSPCGIALFLPIRKYCDANLNLLPLLRYERTRGNSTGTGKHLCAVTLVSATHDCWVDYWLSHSPFSSLNTNQEATLTFVPKIVLVFLLMLVLLPVMMDILQEFMDIIMDGVINVR